MRSALLGVVSQDMCFPSGQKVDISFFTQTTRYGRFLVHDCFGARVERPVDRNIGDTSLTHRALFFPVFFFFFFFCMGRTTVERGYELFQKKN